MTVSVRARLWVWTVALAVVPLFFLIILLVPTDQRSASDSVVVLTVVGVAVALGAVAALVHRFIGADSFIADERGLRITSRRHGDRDIPWSELLDLGWIPSGPGSGGGLVGRLIAGGRYEPGGPNIPIWLAQPRGRWLPRSELAALRQLCAEHGVHWTNFTAAEIASRPRRP